MNTRKNLAFGLAVITLLSLIPQVSLAKGPKDAKKSGTKHVETIVKPKKMNDKEFKKLVGTTEYYKAVNELNYVGIRDKDGNLITAVSKNPPGAAEYVNITLNCNLTDEIAPGQFVDKAPLVGIKLGSFKNPFYYNFNYNLEGYELAALVIDGKVYDRKTGFNNIFIGKFNDGVNKNFDLDIYASYVKRYIPKKDPNKVENKYTPSYPTDNPSSDTTPNITAKEINDYQEKLRNLFGGNNDSNRQYNRGNKSDRDNRTGLQSYEGESDSTSDTKDTTTSNENQEKTGEFNYNGATIYTTGDKNNTIRKKNCVIAIKNLLNTGVTNLTEDDIALIGLKMGESLRLLQEPNDYSINTIVKNTKAFNTIRVALENNNYKPKKIK